MCHVGYLDGRQNSDKTRIRGYLYINAPSRTEVGVSPLINHAKAADSMKRFFEWPRITAHVHVVVGITGASGLRYGKRLLECLEHETTVVVSAEAGGMAEGELGMSRQEIESLADIHYDNDDLSAPLASGSFKFDAFVVVPCSMSTLSKISCGVADNLLTRTASVALKERRKLVLVPRETPLSTIHLQNMLRLSEAGAIILPACPAFYPSPESVDDIVDFIVGRILDTIGQDHDLFRRWDGEYGRL
jgi:4-hydroxy-3-polyprenylbenzoate decarboxylase